MGSCDIAGSDLELRLLIDHVLQLGQHVLRYLNRTKDFSPWYEPSKEADWEKNGVLQVARPMSQLEIYMSSFALDGEQSRSVSGILIEWWGRKMAANSFYSCYPAYVGLVGFVLPKALAITLKGIKKLNQQGHCCRLLVFRQAT